MWSQQADVLQRRAWGGGKAWEVESTDLAVLSELCLLEWIT